MAAHSKLACFTQPPTSLPYTCYEVGHTWTPSCKQATIDVLIAASKYSLKLYTAFYVAAAIIQRKPWIYWKSKMPAEILQSTAFLACNGFLFIGFFCLLRIVTGRMFFVSSFLPGTIASFCSILVERKGRRKMLALYMVNLAAETIGNMLISRNLIKKINFFEVALFSASSAAYMYLFRIPNGLEKSLQSGFRVVVGDSEEPSGGALNPPTMAQAVRSVPAPGQRAGNIRTSRGPRWVVQVARLVARWRHLVRSVASWSCKHRSCPHPHASCVLYVLQGGAKMLGAGCGLQFVLKAVTSLKLIFTNPRAAASKIFAKENMRLGIFLGLYATLFRGVSCACRWACDRDTGPVQGAVAGLLAGLSMYAYRSTTISLYLAWKLVEIMYDKGASLGKLPSSERATVIIYAVATGILFHAAVFEPQNIRKAYWQFLRGLTDKKFDSMNRHLIDVWGTNAGLLYKDLWPDYDPRYVVNVQVINKPNKR